MTLSSSSTNSDLNEEFDHNIVRKDLFRSPQWGLLGGPGFRVYGLGVLLEGFITAKLFFSWIRLCARILLLRFECKDSKNAEATGATVGEDGAGEWAGQIGAEGEESGSG